MVAPNRGLIAADPLHRYVHIPRRLAPLLEHALVQRLRNVSQTSLASLVFPSLTNMRFEHALGAMHLAHRAATSAWANSEPLHKEIAEALAADRRAGARGAELPSNQGDLGEWLADATAAVALLHDIGHPPFSHALETAMEDNADSFLGRPADVLFANGSASHFHELAGELLAEEILRSQDIPAFTDTVMRIYREPADAHSWASALRGLVSSQIDVDRIDYLMRDANRAGTEYGDIDFDRLVDNLEFAVIDGKIILAPGSRARSASEKVLVERSQAYRWIYFHPRVVAADLALLRSVQLILELEKNPTPLPIDYQEDGRVSVTVGDLFADLRPHLNYVAPSAADLDRYLTSGGLRRGMAKRLCGETHDQSPALSQSLLGRSSPYLASWLAAGVHDGTIRDWINRSLCLSQVLTVRGILSRTDALTMQFQAVASASMHRAHNVLCIWKTHEEYAEVAQTIARNPATAAALEAVRDEVSSGRADLATKERANRDLDGLLMGLKSEGSSPIAVINHVFWLLAGADGRPLASALNELAEPINPRVIGFWDADYRDFASLQSQNQLATLLQTTAQGRTETIALTDTSPLVQSLRAVDANRIRLFVFHYTTSLTGTAIPPNAQLRASARSRFASAIPQFIRDELSAVLIRRSR